jgi:hypothetical protein
MTTLAYDGKCLAGDRCITMGFARSRGAPKIVKAVLPGRGKIPFGVGVCGDGFHGQALLEALVHGTDVPNPEVYGIEEPSAAMAIVAQRGKVWLVNAIGDWLPVHEKRMALGAGMEFAIGAMEAGADAIQAVRIAAKRSTASSHGIDVEWV